MKPALLSLALVATALLAGSAPAAAAIDCWMDAEHPLSADRRPVADAQLAPLRRTLQQLNALLHAHRGLHELPRTRLRSAWQIGGVWDGGLRSAHFLLRDHRESMWQGRCGVLAGADRLEPRATVVVQLNRPEAFFPTAAPELADEQLKAWREPMPAGEIQGRPLYDGHMLVLTSSGRRPWVPVTVAEYLDFTERDLGRRHAEARAALDQQQAAMAPAAREAQIQRVVEGMRRVDPAQAARLEQELRATLAAEVAAIEASAQRRRARGQQEDPVGAQLERVRAYRASLGPQALQAQARLGLNGLQPPDLDPQRCPALVRPDPAYPWDRRQPVRAQMLMLSVRGGEAFEAPMAEVLRSLDLDAIEALLRQP